MARNATATGPARRPLYDERSNFHSNPANNGQLYRSVPYDQGQRHQGRPYQAHPYQGQQYQRQQYQAQPYQGQPYQGQPNQGQPYHPAPHSQPAYQRPGYQAQPRPPMGYSNVPPGMTPGTPPGAAPHGYHPARPDGRTEVRTQVTKIPKAKRSAARQHQSAPNNRTVTRHVSAHGRRRPSHHFGGRVSRPAKSSSRTATPARRKVRPSEQGRPVPGRSVARSR